MEHKLIMLPGARNVRLWKFFGLESKDGRKIDAKESNGVFCKIFSCVKPEIRYSGNTTNMVHHLQREHHREHAQYLGFSGADSNTSSATGLRPFVNRPRSVIGLDSVRGQEITRCIVGVMVCDLRPFDIVNDTGFNKMIECLAPEYQLAFRQYYASQVAGKYFFDCNQTSGNVPKGQGTTVIGLPKHRGAGRMLPFGKLPLASKEKIMLSWFLSTEDVEPALKLQRKLIVDQVQRHPDLVPSACIDDEVEIIAVRKYFTENAWQAVEAIL